MPGMKQMLPRISIGVASRSTSSAIVPVKRKEPVTSKTTPTSARKLASAIEHHGGFTREFTVSSSPSESSISVCTASSFNGLYFTSDVRAPPVRLRFIFTAYNVVLKVLKVSPTHFCLSVAAATTCTSLRGGDAAGRENSLSRSLERRPVSRYVHTSRKKVLVHILYLRRRGQHVPDCRQRKPKAKSKLETR